jgi:hypothetical protein
LERQQRATRAGLEAIIRDAIAAGELMKSTNAASLARTIESLLGGSLLAWAFHHAGSAESWLKRDVDAVLAPYLTRASRAPMRKSTTRDRL